MRDCVSSSCSGSFPRSVEKEEGQVSSLMMCERLKELQIQGDSAVDSAVLTRIRPLLSSSIASSLQVLVIPWADRRDLAEITAMLVSLQSLQRFILFNYRNIIDDKERTIAAFKDLLSRLPRTVKSLELRGLCGEMVGDLASELTRDRFPNLEELSLPKMLLRQPADVDCLGVALSGSCGRQLKKVFFTPVPRLGIKTYERFPGVYFRCISTIRKMRYYQILRN